MQSSGKAEHETMFRSSLRHASWSEAYSDSGCFVILSIALLRRAERRNALDGDSLRTRYGNCCFTALPLRQTRSGKSFRILEDSNLIGFPTHSSVLSLGVASDRNTPGVSAWASESLSTEIVWMLLFDKSSEVRSAHSLS